MAVNKSYLRLGFSLGIVIVIAVIIGMQVSKQANQPPKSTQPISDQPAKAIQEPNEVTFDKNQYSLTDPASQWIVVNKQRPLIPNNFVPDVIVADVALRLDKSNEQMRVAQVAAEPLKNLLQAAKDANYSLMLASGYRSYSYQVTLYNGYIKTQGQVAADTVSARPGYSEHQTGLAADFDTIDKRCELAICFGDLPEGKWLAENAHRYGFIVRYPKDKKTITGYEYEPWHFRYVGIPLATEMHNQKIETLEEFFGLPAAPDYQT